MVIKVVGKRQMQRKTRTENKIFFRKHKFLEGNFSFEIFSVFKYIVDHHKIRIPKLKMHIYDCHVNFPMFNYWSPVEHSSLSA